MVGTCTADTLRVPPVALNGTGRATAGGASRMRPLLPGADHGSALPGPLRGGVHGICRGSGGRAVRGRRVPWMALAEARRMQFLPSPARACHPARPQETAVAPSQPPGHIRGNPASHADLRRPPEPYCPTATVNTTRLSASLPELSRPLPSVPWKPKPRLNTPNWRFTPTLKSV